MDGLIIIILISFPSTTLINSILLNCIILKFKILNLLKKFNGMRGQESIKNSAQTFGEMLISLQRVDVARSAVFL
jgi:hypothetical protein